MRGWRWTREKWRSQGDSNVLGLNTWKGDVIRVCLVDLRINVVGGIDQTRAWPTLLLRFGRGYALKKWCPPEGLGALEGRGWSHRQCWVTEGLLRDSFGKRGCSEKGRVSRGTERREHGTGQKHAACCLWICACWKESEDLGWNGPHLLAERGNQ